MDADRFKDRKLTIWHGLKMTRTSKEVFLRDDGTLVNKCLACIEAVEQQASQVAAKAPVDSNPGSPLLPECPAEDASAETIGLVLSFFNSVPEVMDLDSIYKRHLFRELRIKRFVQGSTVRFATHGSSQTSSNVIFRSPTPSNVFVLGQLFAFGLRVDLCLPLDTCAVNRSAMIVAPPRPTSCLREPAYTFSAVPIVGCEN